MTSILNITAGSILVLRWNMRDKNKTMFKSSFTYTFDNLINSEFKDRIRK